MIENHSKSKTDIGNSDGNSDIKENSAATIQRAASHKENVILVKEMGHRDTHAMYKAELSRMGLKHFFWVGYLKPKQPSILSNVLSSINKRLMSPVRFREFNFSRYFEEVFVGHYTILRGEDTIDTIKKDFEEVGISKYRILELQLCFGGDYLHVLVGHANDSEVQKIIHESYDY